MALAATPYLRALLQRSRPLPGVAQGLHAALHATSGVSAPLSALPVGPVSALGDGLAVTTQCALAEPLALEVHTDHVTLAGLPQPAITATEADALVAALNALLGEDGLRCERVTAARWYLHGAGMAALAGGLARVADLSGVRLDEATQPAPEARRLRRLLTEAQMLFHQHPLNTLREEQGLARIDGLWLSGAGALPARLEAEMPWSAEAQQKLNDILAATPVLVQISAARRLRDAAERSARGSGEDCVTAPCVEGAKRLIFEGSAS